MTRNQDPFLGIRLLIVDGTNLLYALRRGPVPSPPAAIIGRLRSAVPAEVRVQIVFDGPPEPGAARRIASGVEVRYGGRRSADAVLVDVAEAVGGGVLAVTDDADLRRALHARGATTARTAWLIARLDRGRLSAPSVGAPRSPAPSPARAAARPPAGRASAPSPDAEDSADAGRSAWHPGRGATRKLGNPCRAPKRAGGPGGGTRTRRSPRPPRAV